VSRKFALVLLLAGCASTRPITVEPHRFSDAELTAQLRLDGNLKLHLSNRTDEELTIRWDQLTLVGPDHREVPLSSDVTQPLGPHAELEASLAPFALRARAGVPFELIVPTVVHGAERVYHFHVKLRKA
jgi:hypothetical protein